MEMHKTINFNKMQMKKMIALS